MRLKRKIPTFIFGVSVGLIAGVGFFVFKINDLLDKLKDAAKEQITVIEQPVKNVAVEEDNKKKDNERFKINFGKAPKVDYKEVDSLIRQDNAINIATDELLSVKNIKIIRINDSSPATDTLASRLANVENVSGPDLYFIEFWKTPLNTKGYKFSRNKIMLYGFMDFNNVLLYEVNNAYYLKASDQVYKLFYGGDFKQMERVTDSELLSRLS